MKNKTFPTSKKQLTRFLPEQPAGRGQNTNNSVADAKTLNERIIYKRYSFNGNGTGYQGL